MVALSYILTGIYILFCLVIAVMLVWHSFEEKIIVEVTNEDGSVSKKVNKNAIYNVIIAGVMLIALVLRIFLIK